VAIQIEPGQWLVARGPAVVTGAETSMDLGPIAIHTGTRTPLTPVLDVNGRTIGCVLGEAVDLERGILDGSLPIHLPVNAEQATSEQIETALYRLGGDWAAVIVCSNVRRLYQSTCRSMVYDQHEPLAAAAPASLMTRTDYNERLDQALFRSRAIDALGWLPAGLTCHRGVRRVLPNHALDLTDWRPVRHWAGPAATTDTQQTIATMTATMTATLAAVARTKSLQFAFTAGHDSRAVLAAARPLLNTASLKAFTIGIGDGSPDTVVPAEICASIGIPHILVPERRATPQEREIWLRRAGHCVGDANLRMHPTIWRFGPSDAVVTGAAGEVGRARQWVKGDTPATKLSALGVIARLEVAPSSEMVDLMDAWLAGLKGHDTLRILDLAHLEHRVGGWASPQTFGNPMAPFHVGPLEHRDVIAGMLALPAEWRQSGRYIDAIVAHAWPELTQFPYNRFAGVRQYSYLAGRAFSIGRIRRKLRLHVLSRLAG
jgi:hypothetical protein